MNVDFSRKSPNDDSQPQRCIHFLIQNIPQEKPQNPFLLKIRNLSVAFMSLFELGWAFIYTILSHFQFRSLNSWENSVVFHFYHS